MKIEDKLKLFTGKNLWETNGNEELGIRELRVADGPHGLRKILRNEEENKHTTCFPTAVNLASTFNKKMVFNVGKYIADECLEAKVDILLGPGVNLKRYPLGGRNFEYYSEDPYLTGIIAKNFINGVQSKNVGTSVKHLICNEQEDYRVTNSSEVDDLAFYNLYFKAFKLALEANPTTVMSSYNKLNNIFTSENKKLLTDLLRNKYNYKGIVISDWGAVNDLALSIKNGLNIEMPYSKEKSVEVLLNAINNKTLSLETIDKRIEEIKNVQKRLKPKNIIADLNKHSRYAKKVADESIILLKNINNSLPLTRRKKTLFIGEFVENLIIQATGSSTVPYPNKIEPLTYLKNENIKYDYVKGYKLKTEKISNKLEQEALLKSKDYDQVVMFIGLYEGLEGEGYDRYNYSLPRNQLSLINKLIENNIKLNIVLVGGSAVELPFIDKINSLLNAYLPGERGAESIIDILYGKVNPSGRLAETYAYKLKDIPASNYKPGNNCVNYKESVYIGYRYFDKANIKPLFCFGYGLSYSKFSYDNFKVDSLLEGSFSITNYSNKDGKEVYQIYLRKPNSNHLAPLKELVSFDKVFIPKYHIKNIQYKIDEQELLTYINEYKDYVLLNGEYEIYIGKNVNEILYSKKFSIKNGVDFKYYDIPKWYIKPSNDLISNNDFSKILNRRVKRNQITIKKYDINTTLKDFKNTKAGSFLYYNTLGNDNKNDHSVLRINARKQAVVSSIKHKVIYSSFTFEEAYKVIDECNKEKNNKKV